MSFDPPKSRNEAILQNMLGANNALDPPKSRVEELLLQILQQGGSGGGVTPEQIAAAVEAYLDEHGVTVTETDPTVPAWAKAANPPVSSVNDQTGAVTVKTPYYLTVTTENGVTSVDKTPAEIDALSAAGYDVHLRLPMALGVYTATGDMRYFATLTIAAFYGLVWFGNTALIAMARVTGQKLVDYELTFVATEDDIQRLEAAIPTKTSDLLNDSDYQDQTQVQLAIAEAAELPSGGSTGDFLRKTASGVAWQTVPSAESNSFGGGS